MQLGPSAAVLRIRPPLAFTQSPFAGGAASPPSAELPFKSRRLARDAALVAATTPTAHVIYDDRSVARAIARLIRSAGFTVETFADAESYLVAGRDDPSCLIADVGLPGMSGLELASILKRRRSQLSVILISAHGDEQMRQSAFAVGAAGFFAKPLSGEAFLHAIEEAAARAT